MGYKTPHWASPKISPVKIKVRGCVARVSIPAIIATTDHCNQKGIAKPDAFFSIKCDSTPCDELFPAFTSARLCQSTSQEEQFNPSLPLYSHNECCFHAALFIDKILFCLKDQAYQQS